MGEIEIPEYFLCPISLQMMKDPVTTFTGITYDRDSIEQWLHNAKHHTCPVTKQPLTITRDSVDLTPNHTLRRLIQNWCSENAAHGVDRIPTPKSPPSKPFLHKLLTNLQIPNLSQSALHKLHALATHNNRNLRVMTESGVPESMIPLITTNTFNQLGSDTNCCLEEALRILRLLWNDTTMKPLVVQNADFIKSLNSILQVHHVNLVNEAMPVLKSTIQLADSTLLGSLNLDFFKQIAQVLKNRASMSQQSIKSALQLLIDTCPLGRNRTRMVEAGLVFELIEVELEKPEKNITELIFNLLAQLCSCADGREQFLLHAAGIAVASKRLLRVSPATNDSALHVLWLIARYSGSNDVVSEMLRVGAVTKLCMVMQANCGSDLKHKARGILRLHSKFWNNAPCIQLYLLTRLHDH